MDRRYTLKSATRAAPSALELRALNPAQRAAVDTDAPRVLILAGAGSGKTRTLTHRVARLIEKGTPAEGIVLATFTNRAAREMTARIDALLAGKARRLRAGTFHALAFRALQQNARHVGYAPGFTILDREDQVDAMSAAIADADVDLSARRFPTASMLVNIVSLAINTQVRLAELLARRFRDFAPLEVPIARVLEHYTRRKLEMNAMDFDDLLLNWKALLSGGDAVAARLAGEVLHVLVDEYQDTNQLQADIAELLATGTGCVSVVGDDAQSIYAFRGARFDNILDYPRRAPTEVHRLTINYRSVPEVLRLANAIIEKNPLQFPKPLEADRPAGVLPVLVPARDAHQQAEFIAQRALELRDEGVPLADQVVLYRAHSHAVELQLELAKRNIPIALRSGTRFFEQAHVKDALAFLRLAANPLDELSLRRALRAVPGVGTRTESRILEAARQGAREGHDPLGALGAPGFIEGLPSRARGAFQELLDLLVALGRDGVAGRPGEMIRTLLGQSAARPEGPRSPPEEPGDNGVTPARTLFRNHVLSSYPGPEDRLAELEQLAAIAAQHGDLVEFLAEVTLASDLQGEEGEGGGPAEERLVLSTVHQAKGLEWRAVFVAGLADGAFPHATALDEPGGEAEERRLLYVAVTRAMEQLYLCYPSSRLMSAGDRTLVRPSRFLAELTGTRGLFEKWLIEGAPA